MERGFGEQSELPQAPQTPSQGSRQSQSVHESELRGNRHGNPRNSNGQDHPQAAQAQPGMQPGSQAFSWTHVPQQAYGQMPGQMPSFPQGPAWYGAQWMPRGLSGYGLSTAAIPPFPGAGGMGCHPGCMGPRPPSGCGLNSIGLNLGGCTPQQSRVQEALQAFDTLNEAQMQTVFQQLQEQFVTTQQRRLVPDVFGQRSEHLNTGTFDTGFDASQSHGAPSGLPPDVGRGAQLDVFAKSEKWLAPAPVPSLNTWTTREQEIIGWSTYLEDLIAWAAQASLEFSVELQHASRWPRPISWAGMSSAQQARSRRLVAILRSAFSAHPRCANLIAVFCEGVALDATSMSEANLMIAMSQAANGYELLRHGSRSLGTGDQTAGDGTRGPHGLLRTLLG